MCSSLNIIKEEQINDNTIFSYQSMEEDLNFYINNGFKLYKDYGAFFESGYDNTRYILEYDLNSNFFDGSYKYIYIYKLKHLLTFNIIIYLIYYFIFKFSKCFHYN